MLAFLQSLGTVPSSSDVWNILVIAGVMTLAGLFSNLGEGTVPKDWRKANIVPIFKKVTNLNQQITDRLHLLQIAVSEADL